MRRVSGLLIDVQVGLNKKEGKVKFRFLFVTGLVVLVGGLSLVASAAAVTMYPSSISIARDPGDAGFHGTVTSQGPPACEQHRIVKLFRSQGSSSSAKAIASDRTDTSGFYDVLTAVHKGTYFTVAKRRALPSRGAVCQPAVSRTITIG